MATINPGITSQVAAAQTNNSSSSSTGVEPNTIAGNFQTFLQLLTTQLKNQNPLDPLDTNQFTAQLVQFAQVEQQLKSNDQLSTLVSLQKTAQATQAVRPWRSTATPRRSRTAKPRGVWTYQSP